LPGASESLTLTINLFASKLVLTLIPNRHPQEAATTPATAKVKVKVKAKAKAASLASKEAEVVRVTAVVRAAVTEVDKVAATSNGSK
jgi:hypothetical protein